MALPGDFTDQANIHGYIVAVHSIREISTLLGAGTIAATIGNHDVDSRNQFGKGPFFAATQMFPDFPLADRAQSNSFFQQGFAFVEGSNFRVTLVNSVIGHTTKEAAEMGSASSIELAALRSHLLNLSPKRFNICLVHHHVIPHEQLQLGASDLMVGGEQLLTLLEEFQFSMLIHGHKHHPRLRYSTTGRLPIFAAGSLSAAIDPITGSACRNTFHIIELREPDGLIPNFHGRIQTWELKLETGWTKTTRASSSFPGNAGFGHRASIASLAGKVAGFVDTSGMPYLSWADILNGIPEVAYLIPSDVAALSHLIEVTYGLQVAPDPSEPTLIGKAVS